MQPDIATFYLLCSMLCMVLSLAILVAEERNDETARRLSLALRSVEIEVAEDISAIEHFAQVTMVEIDRAFWLACDAQALLATWYWDAEGRMRIANIRKDV